VSVEEHTCNPSIQEAEAGFFVTLSLVSICVWCICTWSKWMHNYCWVEHPIDNTEVRLGDNDHCCGHIFFQIFCLFVLPITESWMLKVCNGNCGFTSLDLFVLPLLFWSLILGTYIFRICVSQLSHTVINTWDQSAYREKVYFGSLFGGSSHG
jgi:hypothetical protein